MRLLPEATELIYAPVDGALRRLPRMLGWGRAKLPLLPVIDEKVAEELADEEIDGAGESSAPGQPQNSTPDAVFRRIVRRKLLQPLASVADQYLAAWVNLQTHSPTLTLPSVFMLSSVSSSWLTKTLTFCCA